jgi:hypothetical protein
VSNEPINTIAIQQFIKTVDQLDKANQKEVKMNMATAKILANTLGIVMTQLAGNYENLLRNSSQQQSTDQNITVELDGGSGWGKT